MCILQRRWCMVCTLVTLCVEVCTYHAQPACSLPKVLCTVHQSLSDRRNLPLTTTVDVFIRFCRPKRPPGTMRSISLNHSSIPDEWNILTVLDAQRVCLYQYNWKEAHHLRNNGTYCTTYEHYGSDFWTITSLCTTFLNQTKQIIKINVLWWQYNPLKFERIRNCFMCTLWKLQYK